jgi:beta-ureidopropionase
LQNKKRANQTLRDKLLHLKPEEERTEKIGNTVRCGLVQTKNDIPARDGATDYALIVKMKKAMLDKHLQFIKSAAKEKVQILCFQEIFTGPYFCAEQNTIWYDAAEEIPEGSTVQLMQELAREHAMVLIVPVYEKEQTGVYYNAAAVIDADGTYLGKYRKSHIPHVAPGFWEKFYFKPGNLGYPTFITKYATIGVYICYDRHFPEGARALGLNGAEIVFNPSATVAGLSEYLWKLEQPAHAAANGYFIAAINRVGTESPWNIGEFYGTSYFCNPRGQIIKEASRDKEELLVHDLNLDEIKEVRNTWQFYRDRRPETYEPLVEL